MMAGRPVVVAIRAGNDPVTETGCGISVTPGDAAATHDGILTMVSNTAKERRSMGESGRTFVLA